MKTEIQLKSNNGISMLLLLTFMIVGMCCAYAQTPQITAVTPASGPIGTLVTITGSNLDSPTAFNIGGANAIVISNDGNTLVGMVMPGATNGAISVITAGGVINQGTYTVTAPVLPTAQQGGKLVPPDMIGKAQLGFNSAISADGNTILIGGEFDNNNAGAAWVYVRSNGSWTEQIKWTGTAAAQFGSSVDLSADGNTAIVGAETDDALIGAAYVYIRNGTTWTLQSKLVGSSYNYHIGEGVAEGSSVSLSADGNVALIGGYLDDSSTPGSAYGYGAVWIFRRNGNTWTQDGPKLKNLNSSGLGGTLSADGSTALFVDGMVAYIYVYKNGAWVQEGAPLSSPVSSAMYFGSLSADGNIALVGALNQNASVSLSTTDITGYVFTRSSGIWSLSSVLHTDNQPIAPVTYVDGDVSLSADGSIALLGGGSSTSTHDDAWLFAHQGQSWNLISKLHGAGATGFAYQGISSQLSADGQTTVVGGCNDNGGNGAIWLYSSVNLITTITVTGANNTSTINTKNGTLQMNASVLPANATNPAVVWSVTSVSGSASISTTGLLTAIGNGVVTVTATATDGSNVYGTKDITISGQASTISVTGITVTAAGNANTISTLGGTLQMSAAVLPANASNTSVVWSLSSGSAFATINASGLLTAVSDGIVTVKATANDGSNISGTKEVTISGQSCPAIAKPTISVSFTTPETPLLTSSGTTGNQWFFNGNVIQEATQQTYTVAQAGIYTLRVKQGVCLSPVSDATSIVVTGLEKEITSAVYPNPAESEISLTTSGEPVAIQIIDLVGKPVRQFNYSNGGELKIDIADLAAGSYIIRVAQKGQSQNIHFVKK